MFIKAILIPHIPSSTPQEATGAGHWRYLVRAPQHFPWELCGENQQREEAQGDRVLPGGHAQHHGEGGIHQRSVPRAGRACIPHIQHQVGEQHLLRSGRTISGHDPAGFKRGGQEAEEKVTWQWTIQIWHDVKRFFGDRLRFSFTAGTPCLMKMDLWLSWRALRWKEEESSSLLRYFNHQCLSLFSEVPLWKRFMPLWPK